MANRTVFGRDLLAGQCANAEFVALSRLTELGAPVPYPVQLRGTEVMLEHWPRPTVPPPPPPGPAPARPRPPLPTLAPRGLPQDPEVLLRSL